MDGKMFGTGSVFCPQTKTLMLSTQSLIADKWFRVETGLVGWGCCEPVPAWSFIFMHNLITGPGNTEGTNNDIILIDGVIRLYVCTESGMDGGHLMV